MNDNNGRRCWGRQWQHCGVRNCRPTRASRYCNVCWKCAREGLVVESDEFPTVVESSRPGAADANCTIDRSLLLLRQHAVHTSAQKLGNACCTRTAANHHIFMELLEETAAFPQTSSRAHHDHAGPCGAPESSFGRRQTAYCAVPLGMSHPRSIVREAHDDGFSYFPLPRH